MDEVGRGLWRSSSPKDLDLGTVAQLFELFFCLLFVYFAQAFPSCLSREPVEVASIGWDQQAVKLLCRKWPWASGWTWANNVPLKQRTSTTFWAVLGRVLPAGWGRCSFPSSWPWWSAWVWFWASSSRGTCVYWGKTNGVPQRWLKAWSMYCTRRELQRRWSWSLLNGA